MPKNLSAFAINCTLKSSGDDEASSTDKMISELFKALEGNGVACDSVRALDFEISPGVETDMGGSDQWPGLRSRILDADIFVLGLPIWMGQPSSVAKRVLDAVGATLPPGGKTRGITLAGFFLPPGQTPHIGTAPLPREVLRVGTVPPPPGGRPENLFFFKKNFPPGTQTKKYIFTRRSPLSRVNTPRLPAPIVNTF